MNKNLITNGCGILGILVGSSLYYFYGHMVNGSFKVLCYILIVTGWLCGALPAAKLVRVRAVAVAAYIVIAALVISNIVLVYNLNENRVRWILAHDPVKMTTGTIIEVESRTRAIIQYSADGELIQQEIADDTGEFSKGQRFEVQYSMEYPEMFKLERVAESGGEATGF